MPRIKKQLIVLFFLLTSAACFAVRPAHLNTNNDSVSITVKHGPKDLEMLELLRFQKAQRFEFKLKGEQLKHKRFNISYAVFKNGKVIKKESLFASDLIPAEFLKPSGNDSTFVFRILSQQKEIDQLDITFMLPRFDVPLSFKTEKTNNYNMRDAFSTKENVANKLDITKKTPFLAYSTPYKVNETRSSYCQLNVDGITPEQWYEKYKIKHYIVFYLEFLA